MSRTHGASDVAVSKLLAGIDQLDAIAPPGIKADFDAFTTVEHALLNPGAGAPPPADPSRALEHVASYLTDTCRVQE